MCMFVKIYHSKSYILSLQKQWNFNKFDIKNENKEYDDFAELLWLNVLRWHTNAYKKLGI